MDNDKLDKLLANFSATVEDQIEAKHTEFIKDCLPLSKLVSIKYSSLSKVEKGHVDGCTRCGKILKELSWTMLTKIERSNLLAAAGTSGELSNIPEDCFCETDLSDMSIVCEEQSLGYLVRIESEIPISLTMVFFKEDQELYRTEISEQIPNEVIPLDSIKDWTYIKILRKK